ncbi:helix-turn-helix domain-containing protein [Weissella minor]|uniref:helix-turn-helix domain-containing protein n=1 Tax=Weissella minor TaxID=1620 RepID=UPI003AF23DA4
MTLFDRVKKISKEKGFALSEVARRADIGQKAIYTWKPSKTYPNGIEPKRETLEKVADVLGVSVDYLLGNTDEMHPAKKNPQDMNSVELEEALRGEGASLRFEGKELSDEYKRMILDILQNLK